MNQTIIDTQKTIRWAEERGIFVNATRYDQWRKTLEEVQELEQAIVDDNMAEIKDAIGDIMVTLVIQAQMNGLDLVDCYNSAYDVIKNRTGKMVNGNFVKDKP